MCREWKEHIHDGYMLDSMAELARDSPPLQAVVFYNIRRRMADFFGNSVYLRILSTRIRCANWTVTVLRREWNGERERCCLASSLLKL